MTVETLPAVGVPAEPTTPIKPSEALRLGRLLYPNPLRAQFRDDDKRAACAVSAVIFGGGVDGLYRGLPVNCPGCGLTYARILPVMHLNDAHDWSDDQIVAWLQSIGL